MLKGVIFDHDGTLVDSEREHYGLWVEILTPYGIDFSEHEYKTYLAGVPTRANAEYLVANYPLPLSADELFQQREIATARSLGVRACPLIGGARELVHWVHEKGLKTAIATGASRREVEPTLQEHGLGRYFGVVASRDNVTNAKPAPDVYRHALQQMQLEAADCIAIEDSPTGLQSALACGLDCVIVHNEYSRGHDFSTATAVFDTMDQVREYLIARL